MRKIECATSSFTKRDMLNSRAGNPLKDFEGSSITISNVTAAAIVIDNDEETGEVKHIGVLVTSEQEYFTTISSTVIESMDDLIDIINEEGSVNIRVTKRMSAQKREFLTVVIL